jgi:hypothetical protein
VAIAACVLTADERLVDVRPKYEATLAANVVVDVTLSFGTSCLIAPNHEFEFKECTGTATAATANIIITNSVG